MLIEFLQYQVQTTLFIFLIFFNRSLQMILGIYVYHIRRCFTQVFDKASIKVYLVIAFFVAISFVLVITLTTFITLKQSFDYKFYNLKYWENFDNKMLVKSFISGNFRKKDF